MGLERLRKQTNLSRQKRAFKSEYVCPPAFFQCLGVKGYSFCREKGFTAGNFSIKSYLGLMPLKRYNQKEPLVFVLVMVPYVVVINLLLFGTCIFSSLPLF